MVFIYVLKLEKGKYYVGKTTNPGFRLDIHFNSNGSQWTRMYKPVEIIELIPNCDDYDEDKYTRIYMDKYGIENVRGGSFVSIKLGDSIKDVLEQMHNGTQNKCFICGDNGHFAKDCPSNIDEDDDCVWCCEYCDEEFEEEDECIFHEKYCKSKYKLYNHRTASCVRCGRNGHSVQNCYASTHVRGYYL